MDKLPVRVTLRMDEEMHQMLTDAAKKGSRPLNTEILRRLEFSLREERSVVTDSTLTKAQKEEVLLLVRREIEAANSK